MTAFAPVVAAYWLPACSLAPAPDYTVKINHDPKAVRSPFARIETVAGSRVFSVTAPAAEHLGLTEGMTVTRSVIDAYVADWGIRWNGVDDICFLPDGANRAPVLPQAPHGVATRQLTADDAEVFATFNSGCSAEDIDAAFVELDHTLAYGTFVDGVLVSAASMYTFGDSTLADFGVLTHPDYRERGFGARTIRGLAVATLELGLEPMYRYLLDNQGSERIARAAGFEVYCQWETGSWPSMDTTTWYSTPGNGPAST